VQLLSMLINPNGQWLFPGSPEFLEALGDPEPDYDAEGFAVKNLGFIKFSIIGEKLIEIELHPRNASFAAILAVQHQLQSSSTRLFRIKYFTTEWQSEITASAEQAITRLSQLTAPEFVAQSQERFAIEPRDYSDLAADESNPLRLFAQKWRVSFGAFNSSVTSFAINHDLLPRMLIIGIRPRNPEPVFRFIGEAHSSWLDARERCQALGEKTVNVPDKDYAGWATEFYHDVARTGQPRYDCIKAVIQRRDRPYRTRYERLLLPWKTSTEEVLVTVCNRRIPDPGVLADAAASSAAMNSAKSS